jgi:hypothetical protein
MRHLMYRMMPWYDDKSLYRSIMRRAKSGYFQSHNMPRDEQTYVRSKKMIDNVDPEGSQTSYRFSKKKLMFFSNACLIPKGLVTNISCANSPS